MKQNSFRSCTLKQLVALALMRSPSEVAPLARQLGIDFDAQIENQCRGRPIGASKLARTIADAIENAGSSPLSKKTYPEIVVDVANKLGVKTASKSATVAENEDLIVQKLFADTWNSMSVDERKALIGSWRTGPRLSLELANRTGDAASEEIRRSLASRGSYLAALVVASTMTQSIVGLAVGLTGAALTRVLGTLVGPIGLVAGGLWLAYSLYSPSYRKTLPAIALVSYLRHLLLQNVQVGIAGNYSSGKTSLIKAAFNIEPGEIGCIGGSGSEMYTSPEGWDIVVYPNSWYAKPEAPDQQLGATFDRTTLFIVVNGGDCHNLSADGKIVAAIRQRRRDAPILVCLNKSDTFEETEHHRLLEFAKQKLGGDVPVLLTSSLEALNGSEPSGIEDVRSWIQDAIQTSRLTLEHELKNV